MDRGDTIRGGTKGIGRREREGKQKPSDEGDGRGEGCYGAVVSGPTGVAKRLTAEFRRQ